MTEKQCVLAVDDNSISLATIEQELKESYEVIPINSGTRALQYLKREKPDLILLDIQMAHKDGIETLTEIRAMDGCQNIPVVMLTSRRDRETILASSRLGITDYVVKPFKQQDLLSRIDRILKQTQS